MTFEPPQLMAAIIAIVLATYLMRGWLFFVAAWLFGHLVKLLIKTSKRGGLR